MGDVGWAPSESLAVAVETILAGDKSVHGTKTRRLRKKLHAVCAGHPIDQTLAEVTGVRFWSWLAMPPTFVVAGSVAPPPRLDPPARVGGGSEDAGWGRAKTDGWGKRATARKIYPADAPAGDNSLDSRAGPVRCTVLPPHPAS